MTRSFIHENFLLTSGAAERLYHDYASGCPIHDYHSHLDPLRLRDNTPFKNLAEIWLDGDHYKWRAMRAAGIEESLITGDADPRERFLAWAKVVPKTLGNPLYQWTHMELARPFGINELLGPDNASDIYDECSEMLQSDAFKPRGLLQNWLVKTACSTDDPLDDIGVHKAASDGDLSVRPTFRPDAAFGLTGEDDLRRWISRLRAPVQSFKDLVDALRERADRFHDAGCRASDHGLLQMFDHQFDKDVAATALTRLLAGKSATSREMSHYRSRLLLELCNIYYEKGWVQQFHLGALRNANSRNHRALGPDTGFDTIGTKRQVEKLSAFLDRLDSKGHLAKTIIYNLNPTDNDAIAALTGVFQGAGIAGKIQFGSAWWFNDQKTGIERQLNSLANIGLLSLFVGMVTDSRSFLSFSRHEYFRRVLCNFLGEQISRGEIPEDYELVGNMVMDICYRNTEQLFDF